MSHKGQSWRSNNPFDTLILEGPRATFGRFEDVLDLCLRVNIIYFFSTFMSSKKKVTELKLEDDEVSHTLGGAGEGGT